MSAKGKIEKTKPDNPNAQKLHSKKGKPSHRANEEGAREEFQQEPLTYRTVTVDDEVVWKWKAALKSKGLIELAQEEEEHKALLRSCAVENLENVALNLWCVVFLRELYLVVTPSRAATNARIKVSRMFKERAKT